MSRREMVQNELANWFGDLFDKIEIASNYNLILNAADMVKNNVGIALCFYIENISNDLRFIPFSPALETGAVLAWKKNLYFHLPLQNYTLHKKRCFLMVSCIFNNFTDVYCLIGIFFKFFYNFLQILDTIPVFLSESVFFYVKKSFLQF